MAGGATRAAQIAQALENRQIDPAGALSRYELKEMIRIIEIMGGRVRTAAFSAVDGARASYDSDPDQGANAAIVFSAGVAAKNESGNNLRIVLAAGGTAGAETVSYTLTKLGVITITIGIESGVSTANQVLAALAANAGSYINGALKTGNDGTGAVVSMTAKALTGGDASEGQFVITP